MIDNKPKLTAEQLQEAKTLFENSDRTGFYLKFYQYTKQD